MSKTVCRSKKIGAVTFISVKEAGTTITEASINGNKIKLPAGSMVDFTTKKWDNVGLTGKGW